MPDISRFTLPMYARRNTTIPGLGIIHGYSVGGCSHTSGFDMHFLAEGADEPVKGHVRFSTFVADDGTLQWRFVSATGNGHWNRDWRLPPITEQDQPYYPAEVMTAMRREVETLGERDPNAWFFQTVGAIDVELNDLLAKRANIAHTDLYLSSLLRDPAEPKTHFVTPAEAGAKKGFMRPSTQEERDARRTMWAERIEKSRTDLVRFDAEHGKRIVLLERLRAAMRTWSTRMREQSPMAIYAAAIPVPEQAAA